MKERMCHVYVILGSTACPTVALDLEKNSEEPSRNVCPVSQ